jgi:hypothetical protein
MSDRLALIIANSEFDDPKLSRLVTPSHDAEALAQVLSDPAIGGFDVTLRVNETMPVVRREIARLYQRRKKGDLLLWDQRRLRRPVPGSQGHRNRYYRRDGD